MSELISGKEAWIAKSEHKRVDWKLNGLDWQELTDSEFMGWDTSRFLGQTKYQFRHKPKTVNIHGNQLDKENAFAFLCGLFNVDWEKVKEVINNQ